MQSPLLPISIDGRVLRKSEETTNMIQLLSDISKNFPFSTDIKELRHFVKSKHKSRPKRQLEVNGEIVEVADESMQSRTPSELPQTGEEQELNPFRTGKATFFTTTKKLLGRGR